MLDGIVGAGFVFFVVDAASPGGRAGRGEGVESLSLLGGGT